MTTETRQIILAALARYRGDDFERATSAFRGLTPEQMRMPHGQSGHTRQEILDGYRTHVEAVLAAVREVESLS